MVENQRRRYSSNDSVVGASRCGTSVVLADGRVSIGADRASRVGSMLFRGKGQETRKVVTYWTPLKDAEGRVEWVVLVLKHANV